MIQHLLQKAFGVNRNYECFHLEYGEHGIEFYLGIRDQALICPCCRTSAEVIRKGSRWRCLQTVPIGFQTVYLVTEVGRCQCHRCDGIFEVHPPLPVRRCATRGNWRSLWSD